MSDFAIRQATRGTVKPLVSIFGKSGSGKTMSALLFARGLVGASGKIVLIDSENRRGSLFADIVPGGYSVIDLDPPFSPDRYEAAIVTAEAQADCVVVDSLTHEHNGEGGILDMQEAELDRMAGQDWKKREACKMASWIRPKMAHKHFIQRLLRLKCPLICCLRAEEKTHMVKGDDGKNKVVTDPFSTPLFDPRWFFESLLVFEAIARAGQGGYVVPRKITHPAIASLLPKEDEQIGERHGLALAQWCAGTALSQPAAPAHGQPTTTPQGVPSQPVDTAAARWAKIKARWIARCLEAGGGRQDYAVELFVEQGIILDTEGLEDFPVSKLPKTKEETEAILSQIRAKAGIAPDLVP